MMNSRRWSLVPIAIVCGTVSGYPGETASARSSCYEIRAEAIVASGYLGPAVEVRWYTEVVSQDPVRAPTITVFVHGKPVDRNPSGFQMLEDIRRYQAGAVKFDSVALTDSALDGRIVVEATNDEQPGCFTSVEIGPFRTPKSTSLDTEMLSKARERLKKGTENEGGEHDDTAAREQLRKTLEGVLLETIRERYGSYENALVSRNDVSESEIFREFLISRWCSWGPHAWGTGPIEGWKLDSRDTSGAREVLEETSKSRMSLADNYLKCSSAVKFAVSYAKFGSSEPLARAVELARDACQPFPVAMKMVEVSELVAAGRMEKNSHSWLELTETKAKFGGDDR